MLTVEQLHHAFDRQPVLRGINLSIDEGEIVCLLGPSGCGKTTLLRIIAGLEKPISGDVKLNGSSIVPVPVHQRDFGLMFQDFALFPHLNVAQNVAFGLRMKPLSSAEQRQRVQEVLKLVELEGYERRSVTEISGGEKQRVALARSLCPRPRLLMLDEPLGSLDAALRQRLILDLKQIIKSVGLTAIYVTHDQQEAYTIADRIALMNAGQIEQIDAPASLYHRPHTRFAAQFLGLENIVEMQAWRSSQFNERYTPPDHAGQAKAVLLHPAGLTLAEKDTPGTLPVIVVSHMFQGRFYTIEVEIEGLRLRLDPPSSRNSVPHVGEEVGLRIQPEAVLWLD
ncbi:MAG: ABC transporter ATP-binding protein [bacterium]|nr:ABC transporter ATP-binding protein [bacterium]